MSLIDHTLFGIEDKVQKAILRLREFAPPDEAYYLADSFGKDSCVLLKLAEMAGVRFEAVHALTTVDPPELIWFGREHHPGTRIERPEKSMRQLVVVNALPPLRNMRYCCKELKEIGGIGRVVLTGVRWAESVNRRSKRRLCELQGKRTVINPIIDWTEDDVWSFIHSKNIPYCQLYDEGWKRLGCVMCPMGGTSQMRRQAERWPRIAMMYRKACRETYQRRLERGDVMDWQSGDDMYEWWISGAGKATDDEQICMAFGD